MTALSRLDWLGRFCWIDMNPDEAKKKLDDMINNAIGKQKNDLTQQFASTQKQVNSQVAEKSKQVIALALLFLPCVNQRNLRFDPSSSHLISRPLRRVAKLSVLP